MIRHQRAVALTALVALLFALGGCISRYPMSLSGLKLQPEAERGKTLEFTLANGKQDALILEGVDGNHAFGQSRGRLKQVNLDEVVAVKEQQINTKIVLGVTLGTVAAAALAVGIAVLSSSFSSDTGGN